MRITVIIGSIGIIITVFSLGIAIFEVSSSDITKISISQTGLVFSNDSPIIIKEKMAITGDNSIIMMDSKIPRWIKDTIIFWCDDLISDDEVNGAIQYLGKVNFVNKSNMKKADLIDEIPIELKDSICGFANNQMSDEQFLDLIEKEWFDENYSEYDSIYHAVGLEEPVTITAPFVDETKDAQYYVDRYNNEASYKEWFDEIYSEYDSIYHAVGLEEPSNITDSFVDEFDFDGDSVYEIGSIRAFTEKWYNEDIISYQQRSLVNCDFSQEQTKSYFDTLHSAEKAIKAQIEFSSEFKEELAVVVINIIACPTTTAYANSVMSDLSRNTASQEESNPITTKSSVTLDQESSDIDESNSNMDPVDTINEGFSIFSENLFLTLGTGIGMIIVTFAGNKIKGTFSKETK